MRMTLTSLLATPLTLGWILCAVAQESPTPAPAAPPAEVQQLVDLLRKPAVQEWLAKGAPAAAPQSVEVEGAAREEIKDAETNLARDFRR